MRPGLGELRIAPGFGSVTLTQSAESTSRLLRIAPGFGSVTLSRSWSGALSELRIAPGFGSVTLAITTQPVDWRCGLLPGSGRLHSSGCGTLGLSVADCSRVRVGYTRWIPWQTPPAVADCSRVRVGYTTPRPTPTRIQLRIAPGFGSVTLRGSEYTASSKLRIAPGFGSVTLVPS